MFICKKKTDFIPPFFLETLQIYSKLVIFGSLGTMATKKVVINLEKT